MEVGEIICSDIEGSYMMFQHKKKFIDLILRL